MHIINEGEREIYQNRKARMSMQDVELESLLVGRDSCLLGRSVTYRRYGLSRKAEQSEAGKRDTKVIGVVWYCKTISCGW